MLEISVGVNIFVKWQTGTTEADNLLARTRAVWYLTGAVDDSNPSLSYGHCSNFHTVDFLLHHIQAECFVENSIINVS